MKRSVVLAALFAALFVAPVAHAATVTYRLYLGRFAQGPGTFKVTAEVTGGSFGLAYYGLQLVGHPSVPSGSILTVNHNSLRAPYVVNAALDEGPAGFTALRRLDLTPFTPDHTSYIFSGVQDGILDPFNPTPHLIRGFGQEASSLAAKGLTGPAPEGNPWGNAGTPIPSIHSPAPGEFELGRGTYVPTPDPLTYGINFLPVPTALTAAGVFTSANGTATEEATVERPLWNLALEAAGIDPETPEPSSLSLAVLGALGGVACRRRFANIRRHRS